MSDPTTRHDNLRTFRQMTELWFPERRARGKTYRFSERQLQIALNALNKETK